VPLDDLLDDREPDPRPGIDVASVEALEDHEDPVVVLGLDPDPVVRDHQVAHGPVANR
jgi:hypothetical protein